MQAAFDDKKSKIPRTTSEPLTLKSDLDNVKQVNLAILSFRLLHSPTKYQCLADLLLLMVIMIIIRYLYTNSL